MSEVPAFPDGLTYVPDYLGAREHDELIEWVDAHDWSQTIARRVQHYGRVYDYRKGALSKDSALVDLPDRLNRLATRLAAQGHFTRPPEQVIVNEYAPGQGIGAHVDTPEDFGPVIASISLGCAVEMEFGELDGEGRAALVLEPGSLLVLARDARYAWTHRIGKRKTDPIGGRVVRRARRVSLTFRTLNELDARG